jgi:group II intron reverse transcriptase/maturase
VLDADIRGFFDSIDHGWLVKFVEHRIGDRRILRLIQKWLTAGVIENTEWAPCETGTPQGATISPLLANLYLHYVLDLWAHQWRRKQAHGDVVIVRYADDFVVGFQRRQDAEQFAADLKERLRQFALELHPDKTRLIEFGRFAARSRKERGLKRPESFTFLGFRHLCAKTRSDKFLIMRHTDTKRMRAKLKQVKTELHKRWHISVKEQGTWLRAVVRGYFAYHAVPTNGHTLRTFRNQIARTWYSALRRRSQRDRTTWAWMERAVERWLPRAHISHPWPEERFDVTTHSKSRMR